MKQITVFGDIHANEPTLDAVFVDMEILGLMNPYCLGDLVGYGTSPNEVIALVRSPVILTLWYKHERGMGMPDYQAKMRRIRPQESRGFCLQGCEPLIYTSGERIRNGVEQAMMPFTTCLPLPPVTWGLRTRCELRCERHLGIVPPGFPGHTVKSVPHCECSKRCTAAWARSGYPVMSSRRNP
ncbi:MAG: metallophosphoesterase family protein [Candidatus Promineifilaceae bacterium]